MDFEAATALVRSWVSAPVTIVLEPDHSVMSGVLHEIDSAGMDGALFAVGDERRPGVRPTGVAVALFRDAFVSAAVVDGALHVHQGRVEIIVSPRSATEAPGPGR